MSRVPLWNVSKKKVWHAYWNESTIQWTWRMLLVDIVTLVFFPKKILFYEIVQWHCIRHTKVVGYRRILHLMRVLFCVEYTFLPIFSLSLSPVFVLLQLCWLWKWKTIVAYLLARRWAFFIIIFNNKQYALVNMNAWGVLYERDELSLFDRRPFPADVGETDEVAICLSLYWPPNSHFCIEIVTDSRDWF